MALITSTSLESLLKEILIKHNTSESNATSVARALVAAEVDGLSSHGAARIYAYAKQAQSGKVDGQATPVLTQPSSCVFKVDAARGFAYPAMELGLNAALASLNSTGVAIVSVGQSHHSGAIGYQIEELARKGAVALAFSNAPSAIAPPGGKIPLFGTNPIAFSCPRAEGDPLLIDLSLSNVARGKVKLAADRGESIPLGWAVDRDGTPTTNPHKALDGSMTAIGDNKGAALALMVEILCAGLSDSNFGFNAGSFFTGEGDPPNVAQLFIVFDPSTFSDGFVHRIEAFFNVIEQQPGTRIPGTRRFATRDQSLKNGLELDDTLLSKLEKMRDN